MPEDHRGVGDAVEVVVHPCTFSLLEVSEQERIKGWLIANHIDYSQIPEGSAMEIHRNNGVSSLYYQQFVVVDGHIVNGSDGESSIVQRQTVLTVPWT